jgi:hypothetical protein
MGALHPGGCSKWNPIEHRLFSYISMNWAGKPLRTFETLLGYIRSTVTTAGLTVRAVLKRGAYETGERVTDADMKRLKLTHSDVCPNWTYTLQPRSTKLKTASPLEMAFS